MPHVRFRRPTAGHLGLVLGAVSLFISLGGTSFAARTVSSAFKKGSVTSSAIRDNTIRGKDVRNGTLASNDLSRGLRALVAQHRAGPRGLTGATGPKGERGDRGVPGKDGSTLADGAVGTEKLADGSVTGPKLADGSVGGSKLAGGSVGNTALASGSVTFDKLAQADAWHYFGRNGVPALQSGWVNYDAASSPSGALFGQAGYYVDHENQVHLGGVVKSGTFGGSNPIVTLPSSLCPFFYRIFPVSSGNSIGRVTVNYVSAGGCAVNADAGSNTYVSLDGIVFRKNGQDSVVASAVATASPTPKAGGVRRSP
jgi:hypothetical protein